MDRFRSILLYRCEIILWIEGAGVFIYRYCSALALAKISFTSRLLIIGWLCFRVFLSEALSPLPCGSSGYLVGALHAKNFDNTVFLGLWLWFGLTAKMVRMATT